MLPRPCAHFAKMPIESLEKRNLLAGSPVSSFGGDGLVTDSIFGMTHGGSVEQIFLPSDGHIVSLVAGTTVSEGRSFGLQRIEPNGDVAAETVAQFGGSGSAYYSYPTSLLNAEYVAEAYQGRTITDDDYYVAGYGVKPGGSSHPRSTFRVSKVLESTNAKESTFESNQNANDELAPDLDGSAYSAKANDAIVDPNGDIVVAGYWHSTLAPAYTMSGAVLIARFEGSGANRGSVDTSFADTSTFTTGALYGSLSGEQGYRVLDLAIAGDPDDDWRYIAAIHWDKLVGFDEFGMAINEQHLLIVEYEQSNNDDWAGTLVTDITDVYGDWQPFTDVEVIGLEDDSIILAYFKKPTSGSATQVNIRWLGNNSFGTSGLRVENGNEAYGLDLTAYDKTGSDMRVVLAAQTTGEFKTFVYDSSGITQFTMAPIFFTEDTSERIFNVVFDPASENLLLGGEVQFTQTGAKTAAFALFDT